MAEFDLPLPHRHAVGGQLLPEDGLHHLVGCGVADGFRLKDRASLPATRFVDGKMIRRSGLLRCAARVRHQHMGLLKSEKKKEREKRSHNVNATFAARTPGIGSMAGGPLANGRSLALPGSKDCNRGSATPSDARGLQVYHCRLPQVLARQPAGAAWGTGQIARCEVALARPGAPSRVARWGRNVPAMLGMKLSR